MSEMDSKIVLSDIQWIWKIKKFKACGPFEEKVYLKAQILSNILYGFYHSFPFGSVWWLYQ